MTTGVSTRVRKTTLQESHGGAKPEKASATRHRALHADPVVQHNIETAEKAYTALVSHPDFAMKVNALPSVATDQKLDDLCDKLQIPQGSRGEFKAAIRTSFSWLDPASLSAPEREAIERMETEWKTAIKEAHPEAGKLAQVLNTLGSGAVAGLIGFACVAFFSHLGVALLGPTGARVMDFGGPLLLLITEPIVLAGMSRRPNYAGVNTMAHATHDMLEREYKMIEWERFFVAKKAAKMAQIAKTAKEPEATKAAEAASGCQTRLRDLEKRGDLVRVNQQRNFADMLRRQLGRPLGIKTATDNRDEPSLISSCCCSKLRAEIDNQGEAIVTFDGKELFRLADPSEFKTFKQGGKAEVIWTDADGSTKTIDLNKVRVPEEFESRFLEAQTSMAWNEYALSNICDEMTFMPLVLMLALTAPMGIWMNHHPERVYAPAYMDMLLSTAGSTIGMSFTALLRNIMRSYFSGANVVSKRDEVIQEKLHALVDMKEDLYDDRLVRVGELLELVAAELKDVKAESTKLREEMLARTEQLSREEGITPSRLREYHAARRKAKAERAEIDLENDFPDIQKVRAALDEDDTMHELEARDNKLRLSDKLVALALLGAALAKQRRQLVEARDKQTHDRHAAGNTLNSLTTAVTDTWKNLGRKTSNAIAMALSFSPAFLVYSEVFLLKGLARLLPSSSGVPVNGTESMHNMTVNATAPGVIDDAELLPAMGFAMTAGLLVLMPLLSQRRGLFLWPLHRIIYDGYGIAKGIKAYAWDAPPKSEPGSLIAGAPEEDQQEIEVDDDQARDTWQPLGSRRRDPLDDYVDQSFGDSPDSNTIVIPSVVANLPDTPRMPGGPDFTQLRREWTAHVGPLGGNILEDGLLTPAQYNAIRSIFDEIIDNGSTVGTAADVWIANDTDNAELLRNVADAMTRQQCNFIFGDAKGREIYNMLQHVKAAAQNV